MTKVQFESQDIEGWYVDEYGINIPGIGWQSKSGQVARVTIVTDGSGERSADREQ